MKKTTTKRVYLNLLADDEALLPGLHAVIEKRTGLKITNAMLFRMALRSLAREEGVL